jgi:hypothetical protein
MKVCGVELKSNEANICLLSLDDGLFDLLDCRVRRITLPNLNSTEELRKFQFTFAKLMDDYKVDKATIRQRPPKGKFAGGAIGFKMEAAIQLIEGIEVDLISSAAIKEVLKHNPLPISFKETGLKAFQEAPFTTAFASLMS